MISLTVAVACAVVAAPPQGGAPKKGGKGAPQQQKAARPQGAQKSAKHFHPAPSRNAQGGTKGGSVQARRPQGGGQPQGAGRAQTGGRPQMQQSHHRMGMQGAGGHSRPSRHDGIHANRPEGARFWGRPDRPPRMAGALRDWYWVATPWSYTVDGVYYYGEGYYFDGYNYCYNGGYHLAPPPVQTVVVPAAQPVVTPVATPVVTPVAAPPQTPPPPQRRGGVLNWLFGN